MARRAPYSAGARRIPAAHKTKGTRLASRRRISPSGGELRRRGYREAFGDWGVIMQLRYSGRGGRSNVEAPSRKPPSPLSGRGAYGFPANGLRAVARVCGCLEESVHRRAPLLVLLLHTVCGQAARSGPRVAHPVIKEIWGSSSRGACCSPIAFNLRLYGDACLVRHSLQLSAAQTAWCCAQ